MTKNKFFIFITLVLFCVCSVVFSRVREHLPQLLNRETKQIMITPGEYIVGEDIVSGEYDVQMIKGSAQFMQKKLTENDRLFGVTFNNGEHVFMEGEGEIILYPAVRRRLKEDKTGKYAITHSGFYKAGNEIPEGTYLLSYESGDKDNVQPFVQILTADRNVIKTYDFQNEQHYEIKVSKTTIIEIQKELFSEPDQTIVCLTRLPE